jgi:hypothetical protein
MLLGIGERATLFPTGFRRLAFSPRECLQVGSNYISLDLEALENTEQSIGKAVIELHTDAGSKKPWCDRA